MKNNTLKQMGIKVAAVGMSVSMAAGPQISVYAEELEETAQVENTEEVVTEVPATQVEVAPISSDEIEKAQEVVEDAAKEEFQAGATAVLTIGEGIISAEAQAIIATGATNARLEDAVDAIEDGENAVEKALDGVDTDLNNATTAQENAETAAENASNAASAAATANQNAQNATNSGDASAQVAVAGQAAQAAQNQAQAAAEEQKKADAAVEELQAKYDAAVKEAEEAVAAAEKALEEGAEDAEDAVKAAQLALERANGYKQETNEAKLAAGKVVEEKQEAFDKASDRLNTAATNFVSAVKAEGAAISKEVTTGAALVVADVALYNAKKLEEKAEATVNEKKQVVTDLENAKVEAEKALEAAEQAVRDANADKSKSDEDVKAAETALENAKAKMDEVNAALKTANENVKKAEKDLKDANDYLASLDDEDYEKAVKAAEKDLLDAEDESAKTAAERALVGVVINHKLGGDGKEVSINDDGKFVVANEDGSKQYYGYVINDAGQIDVYEYDQKITYQKVVEEVKGEAPTDENVKYEKTQEAEEAEYTVTYQEVKTEQKIDTKSGEYGTRTNLQFDTINADIANGYKIEVTVNGKTYVNVTGVYPKKNRFGQSYFVYIDKNGKSQEVALGNGQTDVVITGTKTYTKTTTTDKKIENVKESKLAQYSDKVNYKAEETKAAVEAKYSVVYVDSEDTVTESELQAKIDELGEDVVEYEMLTEAIPAGTVLEEAVEAEYTVSYKVPSQTTETTTHTNAEYGDRQSIDVSAINEDLKNGYNLTITIKDTARRSSVSGTYTNIIGVYSPDKNHTRTYFVYMKNGQLYEQNFGKGDAKVTFSATKTDVVTTYSTETVSDVKESDLVKYSSKPGYESTLTKAGKDAVVSEGKEATYKLTIYKYEVASVDYALTDETADATQENITKLIAAATKDVENKTTVKTDAEAEVKLLTNGGERTNADGSKTTVESYKTLEDKALKAGKDLDAAIASQTAAQTALDSAIAKRDELQKAYKKRYEERKFSNLWATQYEAEWAIANAEVLIAEGALEEAKVAVFLAQEAQKVAANAHDKATKELVEATKKLFAAAIEGGKAFGEYAKAGFDLEAAKAAYDAAVAKDAYAAKVVKEADDAEKAAQAAKAVVDALVKAGAKVGDEKLAEAKKAYEDAKAAAEKAKDAADKAAEDAKNANNAYQAALNKLAELILAEQPSGAGSISEGGADEYIAVYDGGEGGYTFTIPVAAAAPAVALVTTPAATPATPAAPAARRTTGARRAAAQQVVADEVVEIPDAETPLAVEETPVVETTEIVDEEVAKVGPEAQAGRSWWWIIAAILAATSFTAYEYNKRKTVTAGTENKKAADEDKKNRW